MHTPPPPPTIPIKKERKQKSLKVKSFGKKRCMTSLSGLWINETIRSAFIIFRVYFL